MAEHTQIHSRLDKCPGICAEVEVLSGHVAIGALGTACTTSSVAGGGIRLQKGGEVGSEQAEGAQPIWYRTLGRCHMRLMGLDRAGGALRIFRALDLWYSSKG